MTQRVACVIPALDAAATLPAVAAGLRAAVPTAVVIAVDDGSRDDTRRVAEAACDLVIGFHDNRGKGAALRAGFHAALEAGAQRIVAIDADGQHDPAAAPLLLAALDTADVAIGARSRAGSAMPLRRRVTNRLSSLALERLVGHRLTDTQSGFRALRGAALQMVAAEGDRYEFETDFLIRAYRAGLRVATVPVPTIYGARSHFRSWSDSVRIVRTIWRHRASSPR